jgi:hypothetical protein
MYLPPAESGEAASAKTEEIFQEFTRLALSREWAWVVLKGLSLDQTRWPSHQVPLGPAHAPVRSTTAGFFGEQRPMGDQSLDPADVLTNSKKSRGGSRRAGFALNRAYRYQTWPPYRRDQRQPQVGPMAQPVTYFDFLHNLFPAVNNF